MAATDYEANEPTREEIDRSQGPVLLEFGADWCGYCQALRPHTRTLLEEFPGVRHVKVADGKGQPLGRSFQVKLWPTLVFLREGHVVKRAVRPEPSEVREGLEQITSAVSLE
jgi:thioredoxin 1